MTEFLLCPQTFVGKMSSERINQFPIVVYRVLLGQYFFCWLVREKMVYRLKILLHVQYTNLLPIGLHYRDDGAIFGLMIFNQHLNNTEQH